MRKTKTLEVQGITIRLAERHGGQWISLTDMAPSTDGASPIDSWIKTKDTLAFLAAWESIHNPNFKPLDFEGLLRSAGSNAFSLSVRQLVAKTGATGIWSKPGRGGGTFAHKDIATHFGQWISPTFSLYLIKEFDRLKEADAKAHGSEWNIKRVLAKVNYRIQTDAIQRYVLPTVQMGSDDEWIVYANEADVLNVIMFGMTAKAWREANPSLHAAGENIRDQATTVQLTVLANLEGMNAELIRQGLSRPQRFEQLRVMAQAQIQALQDVDFVAKVTAMDVDVSALNEGQWSN